MSDKTNNYMEETKPLFRLLRTEAFRFVIVRYNHYSLVTRLKDDLLQHFPERPQNTIDARNVDYRLLVDSYYKAETGFFFVENFDEILTKPEIYSGLNQRRDKLAMYPIALIVFISSLTNEMYARQIMEKMPDLWSFRSLMLDLKTESSQLVQAESWSQDFVNKQVTNAITTTLGGSTPEEKENELNRLIKRIKEIPGNELNLLRIAYQQIAKILENLGRADEAIDYYLNLEVLELEFDDKTGLGFTYNNIGGIYSENGDWEMAYKYYLNAEQMFRTSNHDEGLGATYNNIGGYHIHNEDWEKALLFLIKSEEKRLKCGDRRGLGATYFNLGFVYSRLLDLNIALEYYLKSEELLLEFEDTSMLKALYLSIAEVYKTIEARDKVFEYYDKLFNLEQMAGNKIGVGNALNNLGIVTSDMGDYNKALAFHHQAEKIRYEIGDYPGLVQTLYNIGMEWLRIKNAEKAVDYFILAGYIAKKNNMTSELQKMDWALKEIIKKHGEKNFMEIGKSHYNSWVQHAELEKKSSK